MKFEVDARTIIGFAIGLFSLISGAIAGWYDLRGEIREARELPVPPKPEVTKIEHTLKFENTADRIIELSRRIDILEKKHETD